MSKQVKASVGLIGLALYAATAVADISVTTRPLDDATGGNWKGTYGSCYNVVPWAPRTVFPEHQVGPGFQGNFPLQYQLPLDPPKDAQCIGGRGKAYFDFRIFTDSSPAPNPGHAFVWGFDDPVSPPSKWSVATGTPQWNACLGASGEFYPAGWDSDDLAFEPLSAEIELKKGGNATVAFYLLSAETTCRSQDYKLIINTFEEASGTVKNMSIGRYLVFDIEGIPDDSKIRLETVGNNDLAFCPDLDDRLAENSFVNGIFVDGTEACAPKPTRTKGYWKNHPTVIDGSFDGRGGEPSLVRPPLAFCGKTIDSACDALVFLKKKGGGLNQFKSQGMAALLNCTAFGCPDRVRNILANERLGAACARGANRDWGHYAGALDRFNNSNDDIPLDFRSPRALPKYYWQNCR